VSARRVSRRARARGCGAAVDQRLGRHALAAVERARAVLQEEKATSLLLQFEAELEARQAATDSPHQAMICSIRRQEIADWLRQRVFV